MDIDDLLLEEIEQEFNGLKDVEMGTEKYKASVDGLSKLLDRSIELRKIDYDRNDKESELDIRSKDLELREQSDKYEKIDQLIRNGISIAGIVIPTVVTIWGTLKTFQFEEEGSITTNIGRGFINKLLPKH